MLTTLALYGFAFLAPPQPDREPGIRMAVVHAAVQTEPVPSKGDAADDPAIWIHPKDPAESLIIGTDKRGGLAVYDLNGRQVQYLADGRMNNVDVRHGLPTPDGRTLDIVVATNRTDDSLAVYRVDREQRRLEPAAARAIPTGFAETYGFCLYRSPVSGDFYAFANNKAGEVRQWRLFADSRGLIDAELVRSFHVGGQTEGMAADDDHAVVYIGEEAVGIWKYPAEPDAVVAPGRPPHRTLVDAVHPHGTLTPDVEGLAIYYGRGEQRGEGYLIASSQGDDSFRVYERAGANSFLGAFRIGPSADIDGVQETDGIDVTSVPLGPLFPGGVFIAQDGRNPHATQNFKLVPWEAISGSLFGSVTSDPPSGR